MLCSHYRPETNRAMTGRAGFEILLDEIAVSGDEAHQVPFGQRR
jgi:hypothetical protein